VATLETYMMEVIFTKAPRFFSLRNFTVAFSVLMTYYMSEDLM